MGKIDDLSAGEYLKYRRHSPNREIFPILGVHRRKFDYENQSKSRSGDYSQCGGLSPDGEIISLLGYTTGNLTLKTIGSPDRETNAGIRSLSPDEETDPPLPVVISRTGDLQRNESRCVKREEMFILKKLHLSDD